MDTYAVIGAGKFGTSLAMSLQAMKKSVIVIDRDKKALEPLEAYVEKIYCCDAKNTDTLENLGLRDADCVVVAMSSDIEESILVTMALKEIGVKKLISKAQTEIHAKRLSKIGADSTILPERDMGMRVAKLLTMNNVSDYIKLSSSASVVEIKCPLKWSGKTLKEIEARAKHGVNVIAIIKDDKVDVNVNPDLPLEEGGVLAIVGKDEDIKRLY